MSEGWLVNLRVGSQHRAKDGLTLAAAQDLLRGILRQVIAPIDPHGAARLSEALEEWVAAGGRDYWCGASAEPDYWINLHCPLFGLTPRSNPRG